MIFAGMEDSHDRRVSRILAKREERDDDEFRSPDSMAAEAADLTNFNLVGVRRRLNNIEVGVWLTVFLLAAHVWRHW